MEVPRILVVDDEATIRQALVRVLKRKGCVVMDAGSAEGGIAAANLEEPDVALFDIVLPGMNGLSLAREMKTMWPDCEIIMMTSQTSVDTAVDAIRNGAYDYLSKPFESLDEVWAVVGRALQKRAAALQQRSALDTQTRMNDELVTALTRLTDVVDQSLIKPAKEAEPVGHE